MKEKKTYLQPATEVLSVAAMLMNSYDANTESGLIDISTSKKVDAGMGQANGSGIFDSGEGDDRSPIWDE